jgi:aminopeptidase N
MALPTEGDIAREIGTDVDPDAIFAARRELRAAVGRALGRALEATYERMTDTGSYSPDAASARPPARLEPALDLASPPAIPPTVARALRGNTATPTT